MCGICGIYGEANSRVINKMLQAIRHRGPDDFETMVTDKHSFGASRLTLVSGQNGRQPAKSGNNSLIVLFNGEIYNYRQLNASLANPLAEDVSEVELIGALYRQHGLEAFSMLQGMFAIAILDYDRLILARDGFGIKPLFYSQVGNKLVFASEIKSLLQYPGMEIEINETALEETAVFGFIYTPEITPFKGIYQVEPGTVITNKSNSLSKSIFYRLPKAFSVNEDPSHFSASVDYLKEKMFRTMEVLMGHGKDEKGVYLSGGVDSSLMAVIASEVADNSIYTFTMHDSTASEDFMAARKIAKAIGSRHIEFQVNENDYFNELPSYIYHYENFFAGGVFDIHGGIAFHMLCKRVADYVSTAFSGEGADELFGGYYWSHTHPLGLSDRIRESYRLFGASDYIKELVSRIFPYPEDEETYRRNVFDLLMGSGLFNYHLWSVDRSSSAFGFEIRPPYLYNELAEFALDLPVEYKVLKKETKIILKAVAERIFEKYRLSDIPFRPKLGMPAAVQEAKKDIENFAKQVAESRIISHHRFAKYLKSPMEILGFDLFHWIFVEQRGKLPEGFDLKEFYKERKCPY
jgi:asparagine synthase (glutamine-hydrolysing)